jgi:hypothetical protein
MGKSFKHAKKKSFKQKFQILNGKPHQKSQKKRKKKVSVVMRFLVKH